MILLDKLASYHTNIYVLLPQKHAIEAMDIKKNLIHSKGEQSSEFYETLFELEGDRSKEKGAFWEQNICLALFYNTKAILETS